MAEKESTAPPIHSTPRRVAFIGRIVAGAYNARMKRSAALALLVFAARAAAIEEPYVATFRGAKCDLEPDGALTCHYRVGASLEFALRRVGEPDVRLEVLRDNREGDYTLDPQRHGPCLLVRHGWSAQVGPGAEHGYATISTVNGVVYRTLRNCRQAK
jgi:hypothetical protein